MSGVTTSANAIVEVNKALQRVLSQYLKPKKEDIVDIRFDLPDVNSTQSTPTVSVFLYDVHEDLQLRQSETPRLTVSNSALRAGWVNLSCNYLITYWEGQSSGSDGSGPDSQPDNQATQIMTRVLQALLNNRELSGLTGAFTRVIPPQENLNSLGNFWQALGNRPRLSLMYSITVPILLDNTVPQILIKTVSSEIMQNTPVTATELNQLLWQTLCEKVGTGAQQNLVKLHIVSQPLFTEDNGNPKINTALVISGAVAQANKDSVNNVLTSWGKDKKPVAEINKLPVYITALDQSELSFI